MTIIHILSYEAYHNWAANKQKQQQQKIFLRRRRKITKILNRRAECYCYYVVVVATVCGNFIIHFNLQRNVSGFSLSKWQTQTHFFLRIIAYQATVQTSRHATTALWAASWELWAVRSGDCVVRCEHFSIFRQFFLQQIFQFSTQTSGHFSFRVSPIFVFFSTNFSCRNLVLPCVY